MTWFIYLAECRDGSLYTGVTTDPARRLAAHNAGRGAAYTRSRRPVRFVHLEPAADRPAALRREYAIKQLTPAAKRALLNGKDRVMEEFQGFGPGAAKFFRGLARHNDRDWFERRRGEWEIEVRDPLRALVEEMDARLGRLAPEMIGDPKRSIFRLHRDVRFSADKAPFKTYAAAQFYHRDAGRGAGTDAAGAGAAFYVHIGHTDSLVAGGLWMPARPALDAVRTAIADDPAGFESIVTAPAFRRRFGKLEEEAMLKRMPRGYAETHPAARWLRYRSFTGWRPLTPKEIESRRLPPTLERDFATLLPLVRWLNAAIGYRAAATR
jgi:uncharacterized protein (TIGR02453 family)